MNKYKSHGKHRQAPAQSANHRRSQPSAKPTIGAKRQPSEKQSFPRIIGLFTRYFTILLIGIGNLYIVYKLLTPLTIHTVNIILSIFTTTILSNNVINLPNISIAIVPACIAGSAFYLLLILIMSTADIKPKTRGKAIITAFAIFFVLNITRILILIPMTGTSYFSTAHWIFWHLISTLFVVGVWFTTIKIYKIKKIPVYSDLKYIKSLVKPAKKH